MIVTFLGVRGSTLALGPEFARYGGHTSCVAVGHPGQPPSLLLDAGTGLRSLPLLLGAAPFQGTMLLTHLHWDHLQGLPFCSNLDCADAEVRLHLPEQAGTAREVLSRMMSPPFFPIAPDGLQGAWTFQSLGEGRVDLDGFEVTACEVPHTGGRTFGYRVSDGSTSVAYIPDHQPTAAGWGPEGWGTYEPPVLELAHDVDLLIHDAHFESSELPAFHQWGHSSADYAVGLGRRSGARAVALFHHAPARADEAVDRIVEAARRPGIEVFGAAHETELELGLDGTPRCLQRDTEPDPPGPGGESQPAVVPC
jgi:phosphoribosyl 1,2-cyclic phosphodiesterase